MSYWSDESDGTTFTVLSEMHNDKVWPNGHGSVTSLMSGDLADKVRAKLGVSADTPVVLAEDYFDGGYSEYTQETDYEFELRVGNVRIELPNYTNRIRALSEWLGRDGS